MTSPPHPRRRRRRLVVSIVVASLLVVSGGAALWAWRGDSRCPWGQHWVDQGDSPQAYKGCVERGMSVKPIIYLYPTAPTQVSVRLSRPEAFTAQYPAYGDGWEVLAQPDGTLHETSSGRELYALYYEGANAVAPTVRSDGFVVAGTDVAAFLEETLPVLGLNAREAQEFIVYWLPILQTEPYVYLRFATPEEIDANQVLTVTPAPDTMIRVMMTYRPLEAPIDVRPQKLTQPVREGFTVVEWGGTRIW